MRAKKQVALWIIAAVNQTKECAQKSRGDKAQPPDFDFWREAKIKILQAGQV